MSYDTSAEDENDSTKPAKSMHASDSPNFAYAFKPQNIKDYGLDDSHLGAANSSGLRPITDDGFAKLYGDAENMNKGFNELNEPQQAQPIQDQSQGKPGLLGDTFNNAISSGFAGTGLGQSISGLGSSIGSTAGGALGSIGSSIGSGISSILAFL